MGQLYYIGQFGLGVLVVILILCIPEFLALVFAIVGAVLVWAIEKTFGLKPKDN